MKVIIKPEGIMFYCPGCKHKHYINTTPDRPSWNWNGDTEKPTVTPSVLTRSGHYAQVFKPGDNCWCTFYEEHPERKDRYSFSCLICHLFVTDGKIQYLSDCTHEYAGQTIDLQDIEE